MMKTYDRQKSVCFSGHRFFPYNKRQEVTKQLTEEITEAYRQGMRNFYCGMALGFDSLAASVAISLRNELPDLVLIAVVPFRNQAEKWSTKQKVSYQSLLSMMDDVIVLSEEYSADCLLRRNDYMLEHSLAVIAYYDGKRRGGTEYTCKRAERMGLTVKNLYRAKNGGDS